MGRTAPVAAVAFAAGLAVGLAARGCGESPAERMTSEHGDPAPPSIAGEASRLSRASTRARETSSQPDEPAATAVAEPPQFGGDQRSIPLDDAATGFAALDVEVVGPDDAPVEGVQVYALPAGAPGVDDSDFLPQAETESDGKCRLTLACPGSFDVTAMRQNQGYARAEGVRVPGAGRVRLRLPPPCIATIVVSAELPPDGDVKFDVVPVREPTSRLFAAQPATPGLGGADGWVGRARPTCELQLARIEYEVTPRPQRAESGSASDVARTPSVVFEPRRFTPPATIRVRAAGADAQPLLVWLTFREPEGTIRRDRRYDYRLDFDGDIVEATTGHTYTTSGGPSPTTVHVVRSTTGTVRWSGPAIVSGAAAWDLSRSPKVEAVVDVLPASAERGARVLVDLPEAEAEESGRVYVFSPDSSDPRSCDRAVVPVGQEVVLDDGQSWFLVDVDPHEDPLHRLVAGPVRARPGGLVSLKPTRGGYVVFAPANAPPEGAGRIVIARPDGAPFAYHDRSGNDGHACAAALDAGATLGPFEPGVVTFDVSVGGVRWGRYEVAVREGAWTTFSPRPFR